MGGPLGDNIYTADISDFFNLTVGPKVITLVGVVPDTPIENQPGLSDIRFVASESAIRFTVTSVEEVQEVGGYISFTAAGIDYSILLD